MKFLVVVSALLCVALADDPHGLKEVHDKCQSDPATHVEDSVFAELRKNHENVALNDKVKKHFLCMGKGAGLIGEDGKVNTAGVKTHVEHVVHDSAKVDQIVNECAVNQPTPEETAGNVWKCLHKNHVFGGHSGHGHGSDESGESGESGEHHHHHHQQQQVHQ